MFGFFRKRRDRKATAIPAPTSAPASRPRTHAEPAAPIYDPEPSAWAYSDAGYSGDSGSCGSDGGCGGGY